MRVYAELNYFHMDFMEKKLFMLMRPPQAFFICKSKNLGNKMQIRFI